MKSCELFEIYTYIHKYIHTYIHSYAETHTYDKQYVKLQNLQCLRYDLR